MRMTTSVREGCFIFSHFRQWWIAGVTPCQYLCCTGPRTSEMMEMMRRKRWRGAVRCREKGNLYYIIADTSSTTKSIRSTKSIVTPPLLLWTLRSDRLLTGRNGTEALADLAQSPPRFTSNKVRDLVPLGRIRDIPPITMCRLLICKLHSTSANLGNLSKETTAEESLLPC